MVYYTMANAQRTFGDIFQTCDHPQQRGLAASRRANQYGELSILDVNLRGSYGLEPVGLYFSNISQGNLCHFLVLTYQIPLIP